jgi:hypothetical protein
LYPQALYDTLYETARFPRLDKPVAVRTAFSQGQQADQGAGRSTVKLSIDFSNPTCLAQSLCQIWSSPEWRQGEWRRDVLVMEMVRGQVSGVAFTEQAYEDDLVNYEVTATAANVTPEDSTDRRLLLPKLRAWEPATKDVPAFARRLQKLLRGLRRTFGGRDWIIEWIDDGQICWLIQVQPLTHSPKRDEVFVFMEAMPDPPSPFMTGIVADRAPGLFDVFRRFDSGLPAQRPLIEMFAGRPFFNLSLLTDVARHWGLPTRLVTDVVGGHIDRETGFNLLRFWRRPLVWLHQVWVQVTAVSSARDTIVAILAGTQQLGDSFGRCVDTLTWLFEVQMQESLRLTAALSIPLFLLPQTHSGSGRDRERPCPLGHGLAHTNPSPPSPPRLPWRQRLTRPLWWQVQRLRQARQRLHHEATIGTDRVRQRLLQLAEAAVREGQLPQPDCLWWLYPDEVRRLDNGRAFTADFFQQRQAEVAQLEAMDLPAQIRRFQSISSSGKKP